MDEKIEFTNQILNILNINPSLELKRKIRGLQGITAYSLVYALISFRTLDEVAKFLGYTTNPIKQAIRACLIQKFSDRSRTFSSKSSPMVLKHWRSELLLLLNKQVCPNCNKILDLSEFHADPSRLLGIHSTCGRCKTANSKLYKGFLKERTPSWSDIEEVNKFYQNCPPGYHVDHILPLKGELVNGLHVIENLQYLPAKENISKGNKIDLEKYNMSTNF